MIVEGEAGIGKSRLVEDLLEQARALGPVNLVGAGDAVEKSSPYHAWRPVFAQLFNLDLLNATLEQLRARILASLEKRHPHLLELAPLLNAVLPLDLPDNAFTAQLAGEGQANRTHELLLTLLQDKASAGRLVVVLEDAHWLDSSSWALTRHVERDVRPILLIIATRPLAEPMPLEYSRLRQAPDIRYLLLETLTPDEIDQLICRRLGVARVPALVLELIYIMKLKRLLKLPTPACLHSTWRNARALRQNWRWRMRR